MHRLTNIQLLLVFCGLQALQSCAPEVFVVKKLERPPLSSQDSVYVFWRDDPFLDTSLLIGYIFIGDKGNTAQEYCTFDEVMRIAKYEARYLGGNIIQIQKHVPPNPSVTPCHQVEAKVYYQNPLLQQPKSLPEFPSNISKKSQLEGLGLYAHIGFAHMPSSTPTYIEPLLMKEVYENLRTGVSAAIGLNFFVYRNWGVGLRYTNFSTSHTAFVPDSNRTDFTQKRINGAVAVHSLTPTISYAFQLANNRLLIIPHAGVGYGRVQYDLRSDATRIRAISETSTVVLQLEAALRIKGGFYISAAAGHDRMAAKEFTVDNFVNQIFRVQRSQPDMHSRNYAQLGLRLQF